MDAFWHFYFDLIFFLLGACIGSLLNVCIHRIPREESIVRPRSHCPHCGRLIAWYDNIPLLSWMLLRARCRHCGEPISPRYALVELLTALLFVAVFEVHGLTAVTPVYLLAVFGLILGSFVDLEHLIIPDRVTIGGMVLGPVLSLLVPQLHGTADRFSSLLQSLAGLAAGYGFLWLVAAAGRRVFRKEAMGYGDVKLLGAVGGWLGAASIPFVIMVSSLAGSVVGIALIILGGRNLQSRIPYGPWIALAALLWMLGGSDLWWAYVDWVRGG
ncbi:prepilin peptidase [Kiritimatiella glycovorans]|uniref:Prepilin leader peptidase/N-methyltransferase n=1 Tax=Kiritimatiella glycovorans TaxID=1307763 RepID=A0A0G3EG23_9BACT|nr:A24 family peptidase [Kiritimatiella glycovorans]AKJ63780.1 Type 4 prepilin-like proteins leader peptide-processing enzyme [Kiritimatiella glycovorans]